jgi:retinol dehydrogenase 14
MLKSGSRMKNKICLITGGKATALELAKKGMTTVIVSRDYLRGREALEQIKRASGNENVYLLIADLSSQKQIHELAAEFRQKFSRLDILINNAAVVMQEQVLTEDGLEYQFAVNHIAPFLLTNLLIELLIDSAPSRIINVSSQTHWKVEIDFNNLNSDGKYNPTSVYAITKLMNILFTYKMADLLKGTGVTVNCLHPGVAGTKLYENYHGRFGIKKFLSKLIGDSPGNAAKTSVFLAVSEKVNNISGKYFVDCQEKKSSPESYNKAVSDQLWEMSSELSGIHKSV